jgi:RNA polymerase nonessential primary-like sigma factor
MFKSSTQDELTAWMNAAGNHKILAPDEIDIIARQIKTAEPGSAEHVRLVNYLTMHNLRLVIKFVKNFMSGKTKKKYGCTETVDYLQVGTLGLRRAAECYDPTRGYKFSTYAYPWIRSFVSRYNMKVSSIFHIPENALRDAWYYEAHGHIKTKTKSGFRDEAYCIELRDKVRAAQSPVSLDLKVGDDESIPLGLTIESTYPERTREGEFPLEIEDMIDAAGLTKMQKEIIKAFYLQDIDMEQLAKAYSVTRDKIKSVKESAIQRLRMANGLV